MTMTSATRHTAVTVGTFDGTHSGHRLLLRTLVEEAERRGLRPLAISFDRHPLTMVCPERAPYELSTRAERKEMIEQCGADHAELKFSPEIAALTVRDFMLYLRRNHNADLLVMGYDNTFGSDGRGMPMEQYAAIGAELGIEVAEAPVLEGVSSSQIRKALQRGDLAAAREMLGRHYSLEGPVEHGQALGRKIGFPTANLQYPLRAQLPASGVYAAMAEVGGEEYQAVVNVGRHPTTGASSRPLVEAHLLDFSGDLYGKHMRLTFISRLRDEKKFPDLAGLTRAISADERKARALLATCRRHADTIA